MNGNTEKKELKKTYLQSYQALSFSIKTLEVLMNRMKEEQRQTISFITAFWGTDQSVVEMTDVFTCLRKQLAEKNLICSAIVKKVECMDCEIEKNILLLKYISGYTWEEISEITNYSLRQVYNIHNLALKHFPM
ncbi:sigma-70 family RNA polymerase sigma factor [Lacrimispora defluvii]|uniref:Sigma-70 family RNA polymerase sigma factor n=1 Tax=Lacrimispora defluvii TaxID=2719233 RepID=A0ABX1VMH5_9FIRM|nr:sigma-70 family RNA polymerase sigma factor [Lacrimispora defluvii]NNJ29501.1 sigma-70 family RNA polymerase sigma factor [Lacrimispora defluvii]